MAAATAACDGNSICIQRIKQLMWNGAREAAKRVVTAAGVAVGALAGIILIATTGTANAPGLPIDDGSRGRPIGWVTGADGKPRIVYENDLHNGPETPKPLPVAWPFDNDDYDDGSNPLPADWQPQNISSPGSRSGCDSCARDIWRNIGGEIHAISPLEGSFLGAHRGINHGWSYHQVVVSNGRVYDAFTGSRGLTIRDYKNLWQYQDAISFGF